LCKANWQKKLYKSKNKTVLSLQNNITTNIAYLTRPTNIAYLTRPNNIAYLARPNNIAYLARPKNTAAPQTPVYQ